MSRSNLRDLGELWHRRMGYIHHGALRFLCETMTVVPKVSIEHDDVCKGCVLGNFTKASLQRNNTRFDDVLDLVFRCMWTNGNEISQRINTMLLLLMISLGKPGYTS